MNGWDYWTKGGDTGNILGTSRPRTSAPQVLEEKPYLELTGSLTGTPSTSVQADAAEIFPVHDLAASTARPTGFYSNAATQTVTAPDALDADTFLSWHTAYQVAYIQAVGGRLAESSFANDENCYAKIGVDGRTITAFLGVRTLSGSEGALAGRKLYIVENVQKADIALMPLETQYRLAQLPAWSDSATGMAARLGYTPVSATSYVGDRAPVDTERDRLLTRIDNEFIAKISNEATITDRDGTVRPSADVKAMFIGQLENLKTRMKNTAVFDEQNLINAAGAIKKRFDRVMSFAIGKTTTSLVDQTKTVVLNDASTITAKYFPNADLFGNVISLDDNTTIIEGYNKFVDEEKKTFLADNIRTYFADPNRVDFGAGNVSRLIFLLQMTYNLQKETESNMAAEETRQQNRYLQDISYMKQMIQQTRAKMGKDAEDTSLLDSGKDAYRLTVDKGWTEAQRLAFSMWVKNVPQKLHPLEKFRSIPDRPYFDSVHGGSDPLKYVSNIDGYTEDSDREDAFVEVYLSTSSRAKDGNNTFHGRLYTFAATQWDMHSTRIGDHVTLIQQESQVLQNKVSSLDKEKARHYELASNAVSKMFDMLQTIMRAG